jgi:tripartite-type tricarboxylate transporter receptor subunit TctC
VDPALASVWGGKTVTMVIGTAPGGGYDTYARLIARHMPKHLPGNPTFVPQNMPGASHRIATNFIYAAKPDGLTVGMVDRNMPLLQLNGEGPDQGVRYDVNKITWLGSVATGQQALLVASRTGVARATDLATTEVLMGQANPGTPPHVVQVILASVLGWKLKSVFGYSGNSEVVLAINRGEVGGYLASWDAAVQAWGDQLRAKTMLPIVIAGDPPKDPLLAGVPTAAELFRDKGTEANQLLSLAQEPYKWAWPLLAPPEMEARLTTALRTAFLATMADSEFLDEAGRAQFQVNPIPGEQVQADVAQFMRTPKEAADKLDQLIKQDSPA